MRPDRPRQHRHRPAGQAASAARCWSRCGWWASTPTPTASSVPARWASRPPPRAWTACCPTCSPTACRSPSTPPRAYVHAENSRKLNELGVLMIDLTPAAIGPFCVPPVNLAEHVGKGEMNVNMVTCGGQATIPMVAAISRVQPVAYGEIVATVSSKLAGPGTRKNIDEFTRTTAGAVEKVGGAKKGKAIIIINPAEPPLIMRDTVHCLTEGEPDQAKHHRIHPRHDQGSAEVRARLPPGQRPGVRRQARLGLPGSRRPGRLPAQVRRQPRHHDRRRRPHRRDVRRGNPRRQPHRPVTCCEPTV
jgi:hypothetical protein